MRLDLKNLCNKRKRTFKKEILLEKNVKETTIISSSKLAMQKNLIHIFLVNGMMEKI